MLPIRPSMILVCASLSLWGCGAIGFPDVEPAFSAQSRDAPWQDFLPVEAVLADNPADFDAALGDIRAMQGRVNALKRRARLLRGPVPEAQEAISDYWARRKASG